MSGGVPAGELLPCPFCGSAVEHSRYQDYEIGTRETGWQVSTVGCETCEVEVTRLHAEQAITAWNTRATPTPPIEGRDADVERELRVAKAIARANGDEFANAFVNKTRWIAKRGMSGGRFRDANEPFQSDYMEMARAALQALGERP